MRADGHAFGALSPEFPAPPGPRGERRYAVMTTGMQSFVDREIELMPTALPPAESGQRVAGTIAFLLTKNPVLHEGDTIGVSTTEHLRVRLPAQGQRPGVPVYSLTLERAA